MITKRPTSSTDLLSLHSCIYACKATYDEMRSNQLEQLKAIFKKHSAEIIRIGGMKVIIAFMRKDLIATLKGINAILKHKDAKKILLSVITEYADFYKANYGFVKKVIECYNKKCDKTARLITKEMFDMAINVFNLINDKKIQAQSKRIQDLAMKQAKEVYSKLSV